MNTLPRLAAAGAAAVAIGSLLPPEASAESPLAGALSPHLRDFADSAIEWRPWGDAAFEAAREQKKLVFVSVGYRACPWTERMAVETFEEEAIAKIVNREFIAIKIDRLERPDLDLAFRTYSRATGNSSGWPLNVWLTPAGRPISIGGFYAAEPGAGSPGFRKVIDHVASQWRKFPDYVHEQSGRDLEKLRASLARKPVAELEAPVAQKVIDDLYAAASATFDPTSGGFDLAVKFPRHEVLQALAGLAASLPEDSFRRKQATKMVARSIDGMLDGAIVDPLDGGIFRYANDSRWRTPQFERMLADQARFALAAISAYQITGDKKHAVAARRALGFCDAALADARGGYCASLADDTAAIAGAPKRESYYLWGAGELRELLDAEEAEAFFAAFGIRDGGNITSHGKLQGFSTSANIPYAATAESRAPEAGTPLAAAVEKVLRARAARPAPRRNDMVLTGWNGLMISALARVGGGVGDAAMVDRASALANHILATLYAGGELARGRVGERRFGDAFCQDYIFLTRGLIDLHLATGEDKFLATALRLQGQVDERFFDPEIGLYHQTPVEGAAELLFRLWEVVDSDLPSPNGTAARNCFELAEITGKPRLKERGALILKAMSPELEASPQTCPSAVIALLPPIRQGKE